jgi:hypothetical protein
MNLHQHCCENLRSWMQRILLWDSGLHINRIYWRYSCTQILSFPEWCSFRFRLSGMWLYVSGLVFPKTLKDHSVFIFMGWGFQEPHSIMFKKTWVVTAMLLKPKLITETGGRYICCNYSTCKFCDFSTILGLQVSYWFFVLDMRIL